MPLSWVRGKRVVKISNNIENKLTRPFQKELAGKMQSRKSPLPSVEALLSNLAVCIGGFWVASSFTPDLITPDPISESRLAKICGRSDWYIFHGQKDET